MSWRLKGTNVYSWDEASNGEAFDGNILESSYGFSEMIEDAEGRWWIYHDGTGGATQVNFHPLTGERAPTQVV